MPSTGHCLKRHFWNSWGCVKFALRTLRVPFDWNIGATNTYQQTHQEVREPASLDNGSVLIWKGKIWPPQQSPKSSSKASASGGGGVHLSIGASDWLELLPPLQVAVDPTLAWLDATDATCQIVNCWFGTRWFGRVPLSTIPFIRGSHKSKTTNRNQQWTISWWCNHLKKNDDKSSSLEPAFQARNTGYCGITHKSWAMGQELRVEKVIFWQVKSSKQTGCKWSQDERRLLNRLLPFE